MNNLQSVIAFLESRRSFPANCLSAPYPSSSELKAIAQMGLRVPDHKKLEPWRLIVINGKKLGELAEIVRLQAPNYQPDQAKVEKITQLYTNAGCIIALVYTAQNEPSIPEWEQELSVGAVGISLVNASIAMGFGASWITGFLPECPEICAHLGLGQNEYLRGLIHIGTPSAEPPERPRPDLTQKLTFL